MVPICPHLRMKENSVTWQTRPLPHTPGSSYLSPHFALSLSVSQNSPSLKLLQILQPESLLSPLNSQFSNHLRDCFIEGAFPDAQIS